MRILITPEWYPWDDRPYFGVFCREQARSVAREHDVVVLTWRVNPGQRSPVHIDESFEEGLRTVRLSFWHVPIPKLDGLAKIAGSLAVLVRLRRSGWRPDLIHAQEFQAGELALLLARITRAPVVVSEHYSGFALGTVMPRDRARAGRVFGRAAAVCPPSRDLGERLRPLAPAANVVPVPNPVDTSVFSLPPARDRDTNTRALRLATVGSLVEVKGHSHLLAALARVARRRAVELDVFGDGPLRTELEDQVSSLGLGASVRLHGSQPHRRIAEVLRSADAYVLSSLWENMPCALLEALACGLPAVVTRVGGVAEVIDAENGIVVEPGSADELEAGIDALLARLDGYDRPGIAALARTRYSYDAIGRQWSEVYAGAIGARAA